MFGNSQFRAPVGRTDAQNLHRCLHRIPLFIMEALSANANHCLSSLMIEATTWDRCFQMLEVCHKYLSGCLRELCLSIWEHSEVITNLKVIPYISEILSIMGLHSFELTPRYTLSEVDWHNKEYAVFITRLQLFIHQPNFRYLGLGFPLPSVFAQQLIVAFISNPCSCEQTPAISNVADLMISDELSFSTTVDTSNPIHFSNVSGLKSL